MKKTHLLAIFCGSPAFATVIAVEDFDSDRAGWEGATAGIGVNPSATPVDFVSTGGAPGSSPGFITIDFAFSDAGMFGATLFRGQSTTNASGGIFSGDYLASGVNEISFYIRHNAGVDIDLNLRVATPQNSPGFGLLPGTAIPSGVWSLVTLPVGLDEPFQQQSGTPTTVLPNVGNLQIGASNPFTPGSVGEMTPVTFDLDTFTISNVPEPSAVALSLLGGLCFLRRKR